MYIDYEYYSNVYKGEVPENKFDNLEIRSAGILNYYTFNRIVKVDENIKLVMCELVDYLGELDETKGKEIASESVASHSVTYVTDSKETIERKQKKIISKYLAHTDLMYRGV